MTANREFWNRAVEAKIARIIDKRNVYYALCVAQEIICDLLAAMPEMEAMVLEKMEVPDD